MRLLTIRGLSISSRIMGSMVAKYDAERFQSEQRT
nr:MAG TPA: polymerase cofactor VP35-coil, VIRAL PROTEIN [Caudoviricetes sp.]